ncbi:MAG: ATP-binding protein [bacterium]
MKKDNKKVLIIDDEISITKLCRSIINGMGLFCDTAATAEEGLKALKKNRYLLILLDMDLPLMSGMDMLEKVRVLYPKIQVVIITGKATVENAVEAMKKGACDYVTKPFEIDELRIPVKRALEKYELIEKIGSLKNTLFVYEVAAAMSEVMSLDKILKLIFKQLSKAIATDGGSIGIWEEDMGELVIKYAEGLNWERALGKRLKPGERVCGYAVEKKKPILVNGDIKKVKRFTGIKKFEKIKSGMSIPMLVRGKLLGVINLKRIEISEKFTAADLKIGTIFAEQAAYAVQNALDFEKLKELDELKSAFITNVSHELRTPLMAVSGALEMEERLSDEAKKAKMRDIFKRNILRMQRLVKDLLDFSKMEKKTVLIMKSSCDFPGIVKNSVELAKNLASGRGIDIVVRQEALPKIACDAGRMEQVLINLLSNAIKFSPENSKVEMDIVKDGSFLRFSVTDAGIGIPAKEQDKIFERFYQVNKSLTRETGSCGLGLSIVKQIVELHGGEIFVESPPAGRKKGARFIIKIPVE